jgi:hypothetical protein
VHARLQDHHIASTSASESKLSARFLAQTAALPVELQERTARLAPAGANSSPRTRRSEQLASHWLPAVGTDMPDKKAIK